MNLTISSYGKVLAVGHRDIEALLTPGDLVLVEEKVDGSQVSWSWATGDLVVKSKSRTQFGYSPEGLVCLDDTDSLFRPLVRHLLGVECPRGAEDVIFRGETVIRPRHNTLTYERVPSGFAVLFNAEMVGNGGFWNSAETDRWAVEMGVEAVQAFVGPTFVEDEDGHDYYAWKAEDLTPEVLAELVERPSMLGGKMEGVVIKNYLRSNPRSGRPFLVGKVVRPEFKEAHTREWRKDNPTDADLVESIVAALTTEARYEKAVQALAEQGVLVNAPQDIGALIKQVRDDTVEEESHFIDAAILSHFRPKVLKRLGVGVPEWYKARLRGITAV